MLKNMLLEIISLKTFWRLPYWVSHQDPASWGLTCHLQCKLPSPPRRKHQYSDCCTGFGCRKCAEKHVCGILSVSSAGGKSCTILPAWIPKKRLTEGHSCWAEEQRWGLRGGGRREGVNQAWEGSGIGGSSAHHILLPFQAWKPDMGLLALEVLVVQIRVAPLCWLRLYPG